MSSSQNQGRTDKTQTPGQREQQPGQNPNREQDRQNQGGQGKKNPFDRDSNQ